MESDKPKKKFLLIGWDAADWEHINPMLDQGLLPNLEKFINEGVMGNLATLQPILSPMLWNSAATGKHAYKHGIYGFIEPDDQTGSRPYTSYSRECKALWNILSQEGYRTNVINWWASHPAEKVNGCVISNLINGVKFEGGRPIVTEGTVHPAEKAEFYGQFKVEPTELTAEQICAFIPNADQVDQEVDSRLMTFAKTFAETMTTHAVATAVMEQEPWDFMAVYYTCIDHFSHAFMKYHPPRQQHVPPKDYEIFKDVITGAYRFSDMMLQRLLDFTDENTTVLLCSDHGFESGAQRPLIEPREPTGPAVWHRRFGVFAMKGPNIKKDERIYGASLIDIAPTVLTTLGLPVGEDMDGRPLLEIFEEPPEVKSIPSWEDVDGPHGMHEEEVEIPEEEAASLMKQFVALGYVDEPGGSKEENKFNAEIECKYNLARNLLFANHNDKALELFREISESVPWESRFIIQLAQAYKTCGYFLQTTQVLEKCFDIRKTRFMIIPLLWVECKSELGEMDDEVLSLLGQLEERNQTMPVLMNRIARVYVRNRMWDDAERVYNLSLQLSNDNTDAYQGLSRVYCRKGMNQKTVDAALSAVSLVYRLPHAHLNLGIAMARSGDAERAITAFHTVLKFSKRFVSAHRWLAMIYRNLKPDHELADQHSRLATKYAAEQASKTQDRVARKTKSFEIAEYPNEEERDRILSEKRPFRKDPRHKSGKEFVLVSGLPRSGTSLMMQMLVAGGLECKTDGERVADDDNPKGYYEWEAIKQISAQPELLDEEGLDEKCIKVISMLLPVLPYTHNYKIIFMTRPVEEIAASQAKMIERLGTEGIEDDLESSLARHRNHARNWMELNERVECIEVDYPTLVDKPEELLPLIVDFLGEERLPNAEKMIEVIDNRLYRQKSKTGSP